MIHNNIIIPLKHPYISPEVTFEEMEGDSMICNTGADVTGSDGTSGDGNNGNGSIPPFQLPGTAKQSDFIWDVDFETETEQEQVF